MKIILSQPEIEEAITNSLLGKMSINDDMELKIELAATRGEAGFTASIDVVPKAEEPPLKIQGSIRQARKAAAAPVEAEEAPKTPEEPKNELEAETKDEPATEAETPVNTPQEEEAPAPKPSGTSIFAKLQKPVNTSAE